MGCTFSGILKVRYLSHMMRQDVVVSENLRSIMVLFITPTRRYIYRIMGYFRVAKFSWFCRKNMGIIFRGF